MIDGLMLQRENNTAGKVWNKSFFKYTVKYVIESVLDEILLEASQTYEAKKDISEVGGIVGKHGKRCGVPVSNETLEEV